MRIRPPAVAGSFYPERATDLQQLLGELLATAAREKKFNKRFPKILLVPHAGYIYSGFAAAHAYRYVQQFINEIDHVVILGPAHQMAVQGIAMIDVDAFQTPLGNVATEAAVAEKLSAFKNIHINNEAHRLEHCIEVQLPFLQQLKPYLKITPLLVGSTPPATIADIFKILWHEPKTIFLISSDLSHYQTYAAAKQHDAQTITKLQNFGALEHDDACGAMVLNGLSTFGQSTALETELLCLNNSGDTRGDRKRVVGYASMAFFEKSLKL